MRADNCICGTTTTGTGTLTLAATPTGLGAIDPWVAFSSQGFGTSVALPISVVITEYTDATFDEPKAKEKVQGSLLLGANIGACTLSRDTVQWTQTGLDTSTPTYTIGGSPISIGTAANVLVEIDASVADVPGFSPYFEQSLGDAVGFSPTPNAANISSTVVTSGREYFQPFRMDRGCLVRRASMRTSVSYSGGTQALYFRIYSVGAGGRPNKLLLDLGALGGATPWNGSAVISSALATPGVYLPPGGDYFASFVPIFSGGSGTPSLNSISLNNGIAQTVLGTNLSGPVGYAYANGGATPAPDPANVVGYALNTSNVAVFTFMLNNQ